MTTWQVNNQHTGNNARETLLTPANVGATGNLVQLFAQPLNDAALEDGQSMGQPLVLSGVTINNTIHNVVIVGTQHGRLYAYDGDSKNSALGTNGPLWEDYLVPPTDAPFLQSDTSSTDLGPEIAMTSTPVIDPNTKLIYAVVKTRRATANPVTFHQYIYAINAANGAYAVGPVEIATSFAGTSSEGNGTTFPFNAQKEHERCALAINPNDGLVYLSYASHGDGEPYHGEVLGFDLKTLALKKTFATTRAGKQSGLWNSGAGPAFDADGNMFLMTGNGAFDPNAANGGDWGESIVKLSTAADSLVVGNAKANSWTPNNWGQLNRGDQDLGGGGLLILPDLPATTANGTAVPHPKLMAGGGKGAVLYLIDRSFLGGLGTADGTAINPGSSDSKFGQINNNSVQEVLEATSGGGLFNTPAYFNGYLYCAPAGGRLEQRRFGYDPATGTYLGTVQTAKNTPTDYYQSTAVLDRRTPFISSNGTTNGIVWSCVGKGFSAFDAKNVSKQLFNTNLTVPGDSNTYAPYKWTTPTVVNGKVYVTAYTGGQAVGANHNGYLFVYGLAPTASGAPADPTDAVAQPQAATSILVSWRDNSDNETFFSIRRSTSPNGPFVEVKNASGGTSEAPANATSFLDTNCTASTTYYYQIYAGNVVNGTATYSHAAQTLTGTTTFPTYYENGLVAYWSFDDTGALTARDLTGNGHTGTLGNEAFQQAGGIIGGELFCHSAGNAESQVSVPDSTALRFTAAQSFTVGAWVNPAAIKSTPQCIVEKSIESGNSYGLYISAADGSGKGQWIARSTAGSDITSGTTTVATGAWTYVAMVQDGAAGTRTLYVNGVKVGGGAAQAGDGTGMFWMGRQNSASLSYILDGYMDELRVYNRALAATELPNLMGPPVLGAVSNQTHGSAGSYPLLIAPLAAKKVEAREGSGPGTYSLALTFSVPVTSIGGIALETPGGSAAKGTVGAQSFDATGTVLTVPLTNVGNGQNMYLHVKNIQPGGGSAYVPFNVLWGDVTGDNLVDYIDVRALTSAQTSGSRPLTPLLSAYDVNCDGVVDSKDVALVNSLVGGANLGAQATTDVAFCATAVASSQQNTGTIPNYSFDLDPLVTQWSSIRQGDSNGSGGTYTASDVDPSWIMVDLGATCTFNTETINWSTGAKTYYVDVSQDLGSGINPHPENLTGGNWSQRMFTENGSGWTGRSNSTAGIKTDVGTMCTGRYVRLWALTRTTPSGYAIDDYQIVGTFVKAAATSVPPVVTGGSIAVTENAAMTPYQIQATNNPTSYSASGLPTNLAVAPTTGIISGTPNETGTFNATLTATNGVGTSNNATLTITVNAPPPPPTPTPTPTPVPKPVITSATSASGTVGKAFSYQITASNAPKSFSATGLPAGLSVNGTSGLISGTPTIAGTASVSLGASNAGGTGTGTLTLTVGNPPPPVPVTPAGLTGFGWDGQVDLRWSPSANATGYNVLRSTTQTGTYTTVGSNVAKPYFSDTGLATGAATYFYQVSATDGSGTSAASAPLAVTTVPSGDNAWTSSDIGAANPRGSADYGGGSYTLTSAGADIWGTADAFQFMSRPLAGDGAIVARVVSVSDTHFAAKAGVMVRAGLAPDAANMAALVSPGDRPGGHRAVAAERRGLVRPDAVHRGDGPLLGQAGARGRHVHGLPLRGRGEPGPCRAPRPST